MLDYREPRSGKSFFGASHGLIWRAAIRDLPGPDPADLPFGLSPLEMEVLRKAGRPRAIIKRYPLPRRALV